MTTSQQRAAKRARRREILRTRDTPASTTPQQLQAIAGGTDPVKLRKMLKENNTLLKLARIGGKRHLAAELELWRKEMKRRLHAAGG